MRVSLFPSGAEKAGFTRPIRAAGSSGTVATTKAAACRREDDRQIKSAGSLSAGILLKYVRTAGRGYDLPAKAAAGCAALGV